MPEWIDIFVRGWAGLSPTVWGARAWADVTGIASGEFFASTVMESQRRLTRRREDAKRRREGIASREDAKTRRKKRREDDGSCLGRSSRLGVTRTMAGDAPKEGLDPCLRLLKQLFASFLRAFASSREPPLSAARRISASSTISRRHDLTLRSRPTAHPRSG
jgi:hypothetical protein